MAPKALHSLVPAVWSLLTSQLLIIPSFISGQYAKHAPTPGSLQLLFLYLDFYYLFQVYLSTLCRLLFHQGTYSSEQDKEIRTNPCPHRVDILAAGDNF